MVKSDKSCNTSTASIPAPPQVMLLPALEVFSTTTWWSTEFQVIFCAGKIRKARKTTISSLLKSPFSLRIPWCPPRGSPLLRRLLHDFRRGATAQLDGPLVTNSAPADAAQAQPGALTVSQGVPLHGFWFVIIL